MLYMVLHELDHDVLISWVFSLISIDSYQRYIENFIRKATVTAPNTTGEF